MSSDGKTFGYKRAAKVQLMTQDTRFALITQIVSHPLGLPSLVEIDMALDEHKSTLYEHLQKLRDSDIIERYEHTDGDHPQNSPRVFYGMTPTGYDIVKDSTAFDDISALQASYTPDAEGVHAYADAPRPADATTLAELEAANE